MQLFGMKDPAKTAAHELREAHLQLLQAEAALEHFTHHVAMLNQRIGRLTKRADGTTAVESHAGSPWPNGKGKA